MKNNTTSKANLKKNNRNRRFHLLLQVCKKMLYELNLFSFPKRKRCGPSIKKIMKSLLKKDSLQQFMLKFAQEF